MEIEYRTDPEIGNEEINDLFANAWPNHTSRDFSKILARSLGFVCAFADDRLVGFANIAWDGDKHAFLLDPTVHTEFQRRGIGTALVRYAVDTARSRGAEWLHVDYEPHLDGFYSGCGFKKTEAGLVNLMQQTRVE
jgi:GNAT superfamily N-acetyltransferase